MQRLLLFVKTDYTCSLHWKPLQKCKNRLVKRFILQNVKKVLDIAFTLWYYKGVRKSYTLHQRYYKGDMNHEQRNDY